MSKTKKEPMLDSREQEANEVAFRFMDSRDVLGDMESQLHADFSDVRLHTDAGANQMAKSHQRDAVAKGKDIFFGAGMFDMQRPESRGLLAHELTHTMQQGVSGGEVSQPAPMGAEQGGLIDWFKGLFRKRVVSPPQLQAMDANQQLIDDDITAKASANAAAKLGGRDLAGQMKIQDSFEMGREMAPMLDTLHQQVAAQNQTTSPDVNSGNTNYGELSRLLGLANPTNDASPAQNDTDLRSTLYRYRPDAKNPHINDMMQDDTAEYYRLLMEQGVSMHRLAQDGQTAAVRDESGEVRNISNSNAMASVAQGLFSRFSAFVQTPNALNYIKRTNRELSQSKLFTNQTESVNFMMERMLRDFMSKTGAVGQDMDDAEAAAHPAEGDRKKFGRNTQLEISSVHQKAGAILNRLPSLSKQSTEDLGQLNPAIKNMISQYVSLRDTVSQRITAAPKVNITVEGGQQKQPQAMLGTRNAKGYYIHHDPDPTIQREVFEQGDSPDPEWEKEIHQGGEQRVTKSGIRYMIDYENRKRKQ